MDLNDFELYVECSDFPLEYYNEGYVLIEGVLLTEDVFKNISYNLNHNPSYSNVKIFVWLGYEDTIFQKSAREVTLNDLEILSNNRFSNNIQEVNRKKKQASKQKQMKFFTLKGYKPRCSKHSYRNSIVRNSSTIKDFEGIHISLKRKKFKEHLEAKYRSSWDFFDYKYSDALNGWKDNSKRKNQYNTKKKP